MLRSRITFLICTALLFLSACSSTPDHIKYIPKDAVAVAGVNTQELSKKVAWGVLTGSNLFDEVKKDEKDSSAISNLSDAGIDILSTIYVFGKTDARFENGANFTAIIPLSDTKKWEAYLKKYFPGVVIKEVNKRKEANIGNGIYIGWNDEVIIGMRSVHKDVSYEVAEDSTTTGDSVAVTVAPSAPANDQIDEAQLSAELEKIFTLPKENAIINDSRFKKLESEGHDFTFWLNYDALMNQMSKGMGAVTPGFNMTNGLWKESAMAAGFDFEKGKITGDMMYYTPEGMKDVYKEFAGTQTDKEMLDMLPAQNLNLMMGYHLSPKGLKGILEKTGALGFVSLGLADSGLTTDDLFEAFTGDMVFSINNLSVRNEADTMYGGYNLNPSMDMLYAIKIGNKEKFNKLLGFAVNNQLLRETSTNTYAIGMSETTILQTTDKYLIITNKPGLAQDFASGKYKAQEKPKLVKDNVYGHTIGLYADIQNTLKSVAIPSGKEKDSLMAAEFKQLLENGVFYGGEFKNNSFSYHAELNFVDKSENSLITLLHFMQKMKAIEDGKKEETPAPTVAVAEVKTVK